MASGMVNPSFKAFDFSHENGTSKVISDLETGKDFSKDFQRSGMNRCSSGVVYNQQSDALCQATLILVEKCMKRHSEDIMRVLQGISSRLSHLELYCYNVDKSVGEIHLNMRQDYEETDARLASLEKHLEEISRSVQILRDKEELAENQKVLAKLQLAQKESYSPNALQHNVERSTSPSSDRHKTDDTFEIQNQHLAIVLHHELPPQQQSSPTRPVEVQQQSGVPSSQVAPQHTTQNQHYYVTSAPYQVQVQATQGQYVTSGTHYRTPQSLQPDINCVQFQQFPAQMGQTQAPHQVHHFVQHPQKIQQPQQMISAQVSVQQPSMPASGYPPHGLNLVRVTREAAPTSIHMNAPFSSMPQQVVNCSNPMSNGYGGGPVQLQPPSQHINENSGAAFGEIYKSAGPHYSLSPATPYMMCGNEELKRQLPSQSSFPPQVSHSSPATIPRQHLHNPGSTQFTCNNMQDFNLHGGWTG